MKTAWHIARKDIRRMLVPATMWLAFIVGSALWFGQAPGLTGSGAWIWLDLVTLWSRLLLGVQGFFGLVLAGVLVLEDPLVGRDAFWSTRPISGRRLMAGKLLGAGVLFVMAPAVVLLPVWLAAGFSVGQTLNAALMVMMWHGFLTLLGLAVAALASDLAHHLVYLIVVAAASFGMGALAVFLRGMPRAEAGWLHHVPATLVLSMILLAAIWHQFDTRVTRRTWGILSGILVLLFGVFQGWWMPAPLLEKFESGRKGVAGLLIQPQFLQGPVDATVPAPWHRRHRVPVLNLLVRNSGDVAMLHLPVAGVGNVVVGPGKTMAVRFSDGWAIPEPWLRAVAEGKDGPSELTVTFRLRRSSEPELTLEETPPRFEALVAVASFRGRVLGTMPARKGAGMQAGANRVSVLDVHLAPDEVTAIALLLDDRDALVDQLTGVESRRVLAQRTDALDAFVLRTRDGIHLLPMDEVGAVVMRGFAVGVRRLALPAMTTAELENATLVKVRFERTGQSLQTIENQEVTVVGERKS